MTWNDSISQVPRDLIEAVSRQRYRKMKSVYWAQPTNNWLRLHLSVGDTQDWEGFFATWRTLCIFDLIHNAADKRDLLLFCFKTLDLWSTNTTSYLCIWCLTSRPPTVRFGRQRAVQAPSSVLLPQWPWEPHLCLLRGKGGDISFPSPVSSFCVLFQPTLLLSSCGGDSYFTFPLRPVLPRSPQLL